MVTHRTRFGRLWRMTSGANTKTGLTWSAREREVLDLITRGRTNGEIAEELGIAFATAKWHVSELITKMGVTSREDVAEQWRRERSVSHRARRFARALVSVSMLKIAGGSAAVALTASVGGAVFIGVKDAGPNHGLFVAEASPTATAVTSEFETPVHAETLPCETRPSTGARPRPCSWKSFPAIVAQAKGECDLSGIRLLAPDVPMTGQPPAATPIDFTGCDLTSADLSTAFVRAVFAGANLTGANLTGGLFDSAIFTRANLSGVIASPGVFEDADFTDANLTGAKMNGAIFGGAIWKNTTCPDGTNSDLNGRTCIGTVGLENPPTTYATLTH